MVRFQSPVLWPSCIGFRNLAVNQVHVGSIPIGHPLCMEDIRPDEGAVLKTAGVNTLRGSSPWSSALLDYLVLWPSGEGNCLTNSRSMVRVHPGLLELTALIRLVRGVSAKHTCYEFESRWRFSFIGPSLQPGVDAALSRRSDQRVRRCPRFKSGMGRLNHLVWYANG